jgi:hypothetical protein
MHIIPHGFLLYQVESILYCSRMCRKNVSFVSQKLCPFVSFCVLLCPFVSFCVLLCPFVSFCVLVTDTLLNVSFFRVDYDVLVDRRQIPDTE